MNKKYFLLPLQVLILFAPILYTALGRLFSPVFFLWLTFLAWQGFQQPRHRSIIPFGKTIGILFIALPAFMLFQTLPLPLFLLRLISPATVRALTFLQGSPPTFHAISLLPFETFIYALQIAIIGIFFWMMISLKWEKEQIIDLLTTVLMSALVLMFASLTPLVSRSERHFSYYLVMVFPLAPALLLLRLRYLESSSGLMEKFLSRVGRKNSIFGFLFATVVLPLGIIYSRSRTALLIFLLSCLLFALWTYYFRRSRSVRKRLRKIFLAVIVLAALMGIVTLTKQLKQGTRETPPERVRWSQTFSMFKAFPLTGTGFGSWESAITLYDRLDEAQWTPYANNGYLEIAAEGGLAGGLILFLLIAVTGVTVFKMWRARRHPEVKIIGLGIITCLFSASLLFIFNASLRIHSHMFVFTLLLALGIKIATHKRRHGIR